MEMKAEEWQEFIEKAPEEMVKKIEEVLNVSAREVVSDAKSKHLSGPKMPRGVGDLWNATLQPHTGDLRNATMAERVRMDKGGLRARVYNNMEYAPKHEFGTARIPQRPFLWPEVARKRDEVKKRIAEIAKEVLGG